DFIAQPNEGIAPLSVDFVSYSSDPDGHNIVKYTWDFGDGASDDGTNVTITHNYSSAGKYTAKLTVEDEYGAVSDTKSVTINVYQPKAITVLNANDVLVGNATTIFVDCSDANDTVNLEILKQNESTRAFEPVSGGSFTVACGSITNYTPAEIGIYKVVASIVGCNTMQCHREVQFQARQEVPELETPEINPVFVIGIALIILGIVTRSSKSK
ncbi:MAG: PKD domain-containing protein, partial [Candidatus Diapherotrites archaeon]|nr:PKD domain-containing protein [Candidatus Diapherotrites archaeon]